jgi:hypothetical protein
LALEQFHAKSGFEGVHLVTDRALRLIEFLRGTREAHGPSGGFEGPQSRK